MSLSPNVLAVSPEAGGTPAGGLLGMSFLKGFNHFADLLMSGVSHKNKNILNVT
jgi:hypothetical protein